MAHVPSDVPTDGELPVPTEVPPSSPDMIEVLSPFPAVASAGFAGALPRQDPSEPTSPGDELPVPTEVPPSSPVATDGHGRSLRPPITGAALAQIPAEPSSP